MNDSEQIVKRLSFENLIWIVFIIVSVIDIYGDELLKKSITDNNKELSSRAENLFIFVSLIIVLIHINFYINPYLHPLVEYDISGENALYITQNYSYFTLMYTAIIINKIGGN